jgi:hypothetical protein
VADDALGPFYNKEKLADLRRQRVHYQHLLLHQIEASQLLSKVVIDYVVKLRQVYFQTLGSNEVGTEKLMHVICLFLTVLQSLD